jgi:predicted PurR-regulated permease PerM
MTSKRKHLLYLIENKWIYIWHVTGDREIRHAKEERNRLRYHCMTEMNNVYRGTRILIITGMLAIIAIGIKQAQATFEWLLFAVYLAILGIPLVIWLERKRVPYVAAVFLVVAGFAIVLVVIGVFVGTSLNSFYTALPSYQALLEKRISSLQAFLVVNGITITDSLLVHQIDPEAVKRWTAGLLRGFGSALFELVMILLTVTFVLLEAPSFPAKLRAILGDPKKELHLFMKFVYDIQHYMNIKSAISLSVGILVGVWLFILGVDFPILWGFLVFLLRYVPNVGAIIAAIPAVLLAFIEFGIGRAAQVAVGYLAVEFVLGNVVEPMLMGRKLGLSTVVVIVSLIFWGNLLGIVGVFLCIPLTMTLKFACENNKSTRWIAVLLGPGITPEKAPPASVKESSR